MGFRPPKSWDHLESFLEKTFKFQYAVGGRLLIDLQKTPTKGATPSRGHVSPEKPLRTHTAGVARASAAGATGAQRSEHSRLQEWLILARELLSIVISDLDGLEKAMNQMLVTFGA